MMKFFLAGIVFVCFLGTDFVSAGDISWYGENAPATEDVTLYIDGVGHITADSFSFDPGGFVPPFSFTPEISTWTFGDLELASPTDVYVVLGDEAYLMEDVVSFDVFQGGTYFNGTWAGSPGGSGLVPIATSSLPAVIPIPEPASLPLVIASAGMTLLRRSRRQSV